MDSKRRRRESTTPLTVTFGEAFIHPPGTPQTTPFVDAEPMVIEVPKVPVVHGEPLEIPVEEATERALENLSRGRR